MRLALDGDRTVALGATLRVKKNVFQGLVMHMRDSESVAVVLERLKALPKLRKFEFFPRAWRVRAAATRLNQTPPLDGTSDSLKRDCDDGNVVEGCVDDHQISVGDRLLHLLQRWQVENILLVVARMDGSLSGRLIGPELYPLVMESAKLALEQYYFENSKPTDVAKLALLNPPNDGATLCDPVPGFKQQQEVLHPAVCLLTSETVKTWPRKHQATSDGSGRKGVKQGRVNHFLHAGPRKESEAMAMKPNQDDLVVAGNVDVVHATSGVDWLGISRDEWLKLKSIRVPVKELHYLFMCLVILLEKPPEKIIKAKPTPKQFEEFTPSNFSWTRCREILHYAPAWEGKLRCLHGDMLTLSQVTALRSVFQEPSFNENAFVRISVASVKVFTWLRKLLDEYDEMELGLRNRGPTDAPEVVIVEERSPQRQLQQEQQQPVHQHRPRPPPEKEGSEHLAKELQGLAANHHKQQFKIIDKGRLFANHK